jgi:hypothetical protein
LSCFLFLNPPDPSLLLMSAGPSRSGAESVSHGASGVTERRAWPTECRTSLSGEMCRMPEALQCPWFSGLVFWWSRWVLAFSFHRSWVVWLIVLQFFPVIAISPSSSEILSSACFSLLEWPSILFCISVSFFWGFPYPGLLPL